MILFNYLVSSGASVQWNCNAQHDSTLFFQLLVTWTSEITFYLFKPVITPTEKMYVSVDICAKHTVW